MKKAIRIHITGYIFNIEEDAYNILEKWLDDVLNQYADEEDGEEIFKDIEMRVAELFHAKVGKDGVVSLIEVNEVIKTMGQPEEFEDIENEKQKMPKKERIFYEKNRKSKRQRRFYRDEENNILGGVCTGAGHYLGIDPVLIRLGFILATVLAGFGPIVYIVLWIVTPKAETVSQKLEMKGEPVNINNIEKAIKEEIEHIKEKFINHKKKHKRRRH